MCRGLDHNGRRCPSDTSEARQLRRKNATARVQYAGAVSEKVEPKTLPVVEQKVPVTAETIRKDIEELHELRQRAMEERLPYENVIRETDQIINRIGAGIETLAEEKYGCPTDEQLRNYENQALEKLMKEADERKNQLTEEEYRLIDERNALRDKLHEIASPITHPILRERRELWDQEAPELHKEYNEKDKELSDIRNEAVMSHSNLYNDQNALIGKMLEERNEAMQSALREVGVQFADPKTLVYDKSSNAEAVTSLKKALRYYPQEWVDLSNESQRRTGRELVIKMTTQRAHYKTNALQEKMVSRPMGRLVQRPVGWTPDPYDKEDSEYIDLKGADRWVDPETGYTFEGYGPNAVDFAGRPVQEWFKPIYEYKKQDNPPRGKGWEKVELKDRNYTVEGGWVQDEHTTTYYRKQKVKRRKEPNHPAHELTVSKDGITRVGDNLGMRVAMHEFAHRVEHVHPVITGYEDAFLKRRAGVIPAAKGDSVKSEKLTPIYTDRDDEVGYKDNFPNHYMGKVYDSSFREILSMGMESLFSGTNGGLVGMNNRKADPDYKKFILGVLASSATKADK